METSSTGEEEDETTRRELRAERGGAQSAGRESEKHRVQPEAVRQNPVKTAQLGTSIRRNQAGNGEENPKPPGSGRVPRRLRHFSRRRSEPENKGYASCLSGSQPRGVDKRGAASRSPAPAYAGTEGERKGREPVCPVNSREGVEHRTGLSSRRPLKHRGHLRQA